MKRAILSFDLSLVLALGLWFAAEGPRATGQASAKPPALASMQAAGDTSLIAARAPSIPSISSCPLPVFSPYTNFSVGGTAWYVAVGDFDRDGNPDLATSNGSDNNVSVLLGNGDGTFDAATIFPAGVVPGSVDVGDFNRDGSPDLVTATDNGSDNVSVLLGDGTGSFSPYTNFPVGAYPKGVAVGDFNMDGNPNVVTANFLSHNVSVLLGDGLGSFGTSTHFPTAANTLSVAVADINRDGAPDLVTANYLSNNVSVLLGDGNGSFGPATHFAVGGGPRHVAAGDLNRDGNPDVVTFNWVTDDVSVLLNTCDSGNTTATPTSSPTRTPTSPAATSTPTNPAATATRTTPVTTNTPTPATTASPTPCVTDFSDVHPTDYFYQAVRYLACAGVISGYSDGTFRPFNNTTRGQLTKIVLLGFGIALYTPPHPTFTDVPATDPFYQYIETAAHEGLVSGYSDGTFRPFNNVTRGQLCKIVVIAAGWPLLDPPTPTFTDVPYGSTFYQYVETAFDHGIISGYSDGTLRPGNNATRGQIARIVYNAITSFPLVRRVTLKFLGDYLLEGHRAAVRSCPFPYPVVNPFTSPCYSTLHARGSPGSRGVSRSPFPLAGLRKAMRLSRRWARSGSTAR